MKEEPKRPKRPGDIDWVTLAANAALDRMPDGSRFILLAIPKPDKDGNAVCRYTSNCNRSDALNVMKEWIIKCGGQEDWMEHIK